MQPEDSSSPDPLTPAPLALDELVQLFAQTQLATQSQAARAVDNALVVRNWLFGWYIVEYEQHGTDRAEYGKGLLKNLATMLKIRGCSERNLASFRKFYLSYADILQALPAKSAHSATTTPHSISQLIQQQSLKSITQTLQATFSLGWTHYVSLIAIKHKEERAFYEIEATKNSWGYRELDRQIQSALFERLSLSRDPSEINKLATSGQLIEKPSDLIKNPYILEFTGLEQQANYSEHHLESTLIDKIEHFLLELGKGFLFEARQKRFTFDNRHFYVDLVFYNRLLHSYVIIDLKVGDLKHQDLGQMQMYVNYFDRHVKTPEEKPTVGILLCLSKSEELVELTLPENSNIYASEYQLYLPSKKELKQQLSEIQQNWQQP